VLSIDSTLTMPITPPKTVPMAMIPGKPVDPRSTVAPAKLDTRMKNRVPTKIASITTVPKISPGVVNWIRAEIRPRRSPVRTRLIAGLVRGVLRCTSFDAIAVPLRPPRYPDRGPIRPARRRRGRHLECRPADLQVGDR